MPSPLLNLLFLLPLAALGADRVPVPVAGERLEVMPVKGEKADVSLEVYREGKLRQSFPNLGEDFAPVTRDGKDAPVQVLSLPNDGAVIFLRTTQPPLTGTLWAFRWDKAQGAFAIVTRAGGDRSLPVPRSGKVELSSGGELRYTMPGSGGQKKLHWSANGFEPADRK